jgi:coenzyme F420-0:L-glutamate ligase/coenzyme F420-1:gamma-L-glutamate ligase
MTTRSLTLSALEGIPLVRPGDKLGAFLVEALVRHGIEPRSKDILVVCQKVVSKAEGRIVDLATVQPSERATALAQEVGKDPRLIEVILSESSNVIRSRRDVLIMAHRLGFVMANAGVDQSNVDPAKSVVLLPSKPDHSADVLKSELDVEFGVDLGVIISDSFGRAWRNGAVGVALGAAGVPALVSLIGTSDLFGRKLNVTEVGFADQVASAAALLMGEADEGCPAVHVRGLTPTAKARPAAALIRSAETDLFR